MTEERLFFSVREVSEALGVHKNTIHKHIVSGAIPVVRLGGRVLIPRQWVEKLGQRERK